MAARTLEELADGFSVFGAWEDKYRYLIELGQRLEPLDSRLKTEENLVRGCTSRVWMVAETGSGGRLRFRADSDAHIVKGLIYILSVAYQDKTPEEIAVVDIDEAFGRIGLHHHLSPNRRNGFFAMVRRIKDLAGDASPTRVSGRST